MNNVAVTEFTRQGDLSSVGHPIDRRNEVCRRFRGAAADVASHAAAVSPTMEVVFDTSQPGGHPFRVLDVGKATGLGFRAQIDLAHGVESLVEYERERLGKVR